MFNAGVFGMAVVFAYVGLMEIAFQNDWAVGIYAWLTLGLFVGLPLLYVVGSLVLILNGRTMAEREGISLAHMLAPVVGAFPLLIVAALVGVALIALTGNDQAW